MGTIKRNMYNLMTVLFAGTLVAAGSIVVFRTTFPKDLSLSEDGFYEIYTAYDYERFWRKAESQDFIDGRLMADIYLNDLSSYKSWGAKSPLNEALGPESFIGDFDGNGHTIYGLYTQEGYGLVEKNRGRIHDLTIRNSLILGYDNIGGICWQNTGRIENCVFEGELRTKEEEPEAESKIAGICGENEGTLIKCGYRGTMTIKTGWLWEGVRAGICAGNRGYAESCYNLVKLNSYTSSGTCYAIADDGIKGCYVRQDSYWKLPESDREQMIELDEEEAFYLPFMIERDILEWYSDNITYPECIRQAEEINAGFRKKNQEEEERKVAEDGRAKTGYGTAKVLLWEQPGNNKESELDMQLWAGSIRLDDGHILPKEALADAQVKDFVREALWHKGENWKDIRLEEAEISKFSSGEKAQPVSGLRILDTDNGEAVKIHAYLLEKDSVPVKENISEGKMETWGIDGESLWSVCGELLAEQQGQGAASWKHRTWQILDGKYKKPEGSFVLYLAEEGEKGFFYQKERMLYQVTTEDSACETMEEMERLVKENDGLWESLLLNVWESRLPGDGLCWQDEKVRKEAYTQAGFYYGEEVPSLEQITEIESLDIYNFSEVKTLEDLRNFPKLERLRLWAYEETDFDLIQSITPNLEELSMEGICLKRENLEALKEFWGLKKLRLVNCGITELSFLENRMDLVSLVLDGNEIEDISPIVGLRNLKELSLADNHVEDVRALAELTKLETLNLENNEIKEITAFRKLTRLRELNLGENHIQNISPLTEMKDLEELRLPGNRIENYASLSNMERLCVLSIENNPGQEIGKAVFTPLFSGGNYHRGERDTILEGQELLDRYYAGQGLVARELAKGDLNGDGREDAAVAGLSPKTEESDEWQKRSIYVFLGQADGDFRPIEPLETLDAYDAGSEFDSISWQQSAAEFDVYQGMLIAEQMLVICLSGYDCDTRWDETETYRYEAGKMAENYQVEIDWIYGGGDAVFTFCNREEGIYQDYVIARDEEGHREALFISEEDSLQKSDGGELRRTLEEGLKEIEKKAGYALPEVYDGALEPTVMFWGGEAYEYRMRSYPVKTSPSQALACTADEILTDAIALPVTGYTSEEIKANHDRLAGVELPEEFYVGWMEDVPTMLVYDSCELEEEGGYVHCFTIRKCAEEHLGWFWGGTIYFYEDSGRIVVEE